METLKGTVQTAPAGKVGCDINYEVTSELAKSLIDNGYSFVVRYIPRAPHSNSGGDLSNAEAAVILASGLALMAVQHVQNGEWLPSAELGTTYGSYAASYAKNTVGLPAGINIWLDLESVSLEASKDDVIAYCEAWYAAVKAVGYVPGIYIGWQVIINNDDAYEKLSFSHYWAAYNADVVPSVRGYQMVQGTQKSVSGIEIDPDTIKADHKGGTPIWLSV